MKNRNTTWAGMAVLSLVCGAQAAKYYWINPAGGTFDDGLNWSLTEGGAVANAAPSSAADSANFPASGFSGDTYTVRVTNSVTTSANSSREFAFPSGKRLVLDIASGVCWTLLPLGSDSYVNFPGESSTVAVTNGAWCAGKHVNLASAAASHDLTLSVSGTGTVVSNQAWDIWVGKAGYGNRLVVTNGGTVLSTRGVYIGGDAVSASNNAAEVRGAGSLLYATSAENNSLAGAVAIGRDGSGNRLTVADGGTVYAGYFVNNYSLYLGRNDAAARNVLEVLAGGTMIVSNMTAIGVNGSGNLLRVDGGILTNDAGTVFHVGAGNGDSNRMEVVNGGLVSVWGHVRLGVTSNSTYNVALVSDPGSQLRTRAYDISVGTLGHFNTMVVSNGAQTVAKRSFYVGGEPDSSTGWPSNNTLWVAGAGTVVTNEGGNNDGLHIGKRGQGNRLIVEDGASVRVSYIYIGEAAGASGNELVATDSTLALRGHMYIGYSAGTSNNAVRLVRSRYVSSQFDLDVGYAGNDNLLSLEEGSTANIPREVFIGRTATATNNVLSVEKSAFTTSNNYTHVRNGSRLRLLGDSNTVVVAHLTLTNAMSALEFRVDSTNFRPLKVRWHTYLRDSTKLVVDAKKLQEAGVIGNVSVPLISVIEPSGSMNADLSAMTVETEPPGCEVAIIGKNVVLTNVPGRPGTMILLQ